MPKSKRARVVPTSKTKKNRKELVRRLHSNIQSAADEYDYIWVFDVQNMRNNSLKDVRSQFSDSRLFMGKTKLMLHALGSTPETAHLPGTHLLAPYMSGEIGLLLTSRPAAEVESFFANYASLDYARAGVTARSDFVIPKGELTTRYGVEGGQDDPIPISVEPTLRKLGVPTRLVKGKVVLEATDEDELEGYRVCQIGDTLDSKQTTLLKIFGIRMAEFRVGLKAVWEGNRGTVREIGRMEIDDKL